MQETFLEQVLGHEPGNSDYDRWKKKQFKPERPERDYKKILVRLREIESQIDEMYGHRFTAEELAAIKQTVRQRIVNIEERLSGEVRAQLGDATTIASPARGSEIWKKVEQKKEEVPQNEERMNVFQRENKKRKENR